MKGFRRQATIRSVPTSRLILTAVNMGTNSPENDSDDSVNIFTTALPITINIAVVVTLKTLPRDLFLINLTEYFRIHEMRYLINL